MEADQQYKGKVLRISGEISRIDRDITDGIYITLDTGDPLGSVQCFFSEVHAGWVAQLSKGELITVKGKCEGKFMNVSVKGCVIK